MSKQEDEPLDPAVEAIRVKMVRLLIVSGGIMMLGLMAVLISIVYKINQEEVSAPTSSLVQSEHVVKVPRGARILHAVESDGRLTLTLQLGDGSTRIQLHDLQGALVAGYSVEEE